MVGSSDCARCERCVCRAVGDVNVNVEVEGGWVSGCGGGCWRDERMAACVGSRRDVSMSDKVGGELLIESVGGCFAVVVDASASQAAFSSSRLYSCQFDLNQAAMNSHLTV